MKTTKNKDGSEERAPFSMVSFTLMVTLILLFIASQLYFVLSNMMEN